MKIAFSPDGKRLVTLKDGIFREATLYIPLDQCIKGKLYRISARNFGYGVYNGDGGFIGVREKFGNEYLFTEYHWDTGAPFGTVHPKEELDLVPEDIEICETLGTIDGKTGKALAFDKPRSEGGKGWHDPETGESCDCMPQSVSNEKLFQWIQGKIDQYGYE